jgi:hypothetical protein
VKETRKQREKKSRVLTSVLLITIVIVLVGVPIGFLQFQSSKTGKTWSQLLGRLASKNETTTPVDAPKGKKIDFLVPQAIGNSFSAPPMISNIQAVDLDKDGLMDVVVCDTWSNTVSWIRQWPAGVYTELACADSIPAPSHVEAMDFDRDGDLDLMVSSLGMVFPSNDKIGAIYILENDGKIHFQKHLIVDHVARVSDVRAGDLDGDGDNDLAAVQFGYDDGETRWLENLGNWKFKSHIIQTLSGGINCELVDIDNDGDLDIVTVISQEWEEIYLFVNSGKGVFESRLLYGATNDDFGSSGIFVTDLDKDGDLDIVYTNGDAFDYIPPRPRPWHGINWLENKGNYQFEFHRVANFGGAYSARPLDVDHDGDLDVFVVSGFNLWSDSSAQSFLWLENDGKMNFSKHDIANSPTHLLCLALGDFNNDGEVDMVTCGMHAYPPYDRMGRITLWMNQWQRRR